MRKILVSLLVVAMVLGLVGTAGAAYTDAVNNEFIDKVSGFGWMQGYPDGTFKPAGNITRAEASAVVVRALGLGPAADAAKGLGTKFADVPATHWASGYINVCTTKGVLKGYPDGTFKPEANVTGAEVITMIVRAMNRESEALGEWPIGHITVAAANAIIGSGFVANSPATRGEVATYFAKAANKKHLELTTTGWVESTKTFVSYNNLELAAEKVAVSAVDTTNVTLTAGGTTYTLATGYVIAGGKALRDLIGYSVNLYRNKDTGKVVLVEVSPTTVVKTGTIKTVGANYFYLYDDTTKYELATGAVVYLNGLVKTMTDILPDDTAEFYMTSGKVDYLKATRFNKGHRIVQSVTAIGDIATQKINVRSAGVTETYYMDANVIIELDGAVVTLAALKENHVVSIQAEGSTALYIKGTSKTITGKVTAKRTYDALDTANYYFSVDGVEYRLESGAELKGIAYVSVATTYSNISVGDVVTTYLSIRGRAKMLDLTTATAKYGKLLSWTTGGDYDKWVIDIKGVATTFEVRKESGTSLHSALIVGFAANDYVYIVTDSDGRLTTGTVEVKVTDLVGHTATGFGLRIEESSGNLVKVMTPASAWPPAVGTYEWKPVATDAVIYADGSYGSVANMTKDSKMKYKLDTEGVKIVFAIVDTVAYVDTTKITAQAGKLLVGAQTSAVERSWQAAGGHTATELFFYSDAAMTTAVNYTAIVNLPGTTTVGGTAGTALNSIFANANGTFAVSFPNAIKIYVKVVDQFGMETTFSITLQP
jgi:hypothetical protein